MGSLVRRISSEGSAGYGVNILEVLPPGQIRSGGSTVVAIVGDFPWGPVNVLTEVNTAGEFFATFCPPAFSAAGTYAAMDAFLNKAFPAGMQICRIAPTSVVAATAAKTYNDGAGTPASSTTVTAKYPGLLGSSISVAWSENATDATARDATVTIGTTYSVTYPSVATIVSTALVVTDPGDPFVTFSKHASGTLVPAVAAASALTGGADGTAVAGDYVGSSSSAVGIRLLYADAVDPDVTFVASCPSGLIASVNTGLEAFAADTNKGVVVLSVPASQTEAQAKAYVVDYRDDRIVYPWPRVKTTDFYDTTAPVITVDPCSFMAALIAATDPWLSPGGPRQSRGPLVGITGLENASISTSGYDALSAAGVCSIAMFGGSAIVRKAVTTSTTSGLEKIRRRRTADYLEKAIATRLQEYVETPLDLDLTTQALGPNTGAEIGEVSAYLANEKFKGHIKDYAVDPWGSATALDLAAGIWTIAIAVTTYSDQDTIILRFNVGDGVVTSSSS